MVPITVLSTKNLTRGLAFTRLHNLTAGLSHHSTWLRFWSIYYFIGPPSSRFLLGNRLFSLAVSPIFQGMSVAENPIPPNRKGPSWKERGGSQEINTHHMYGEAETYKIHEGCSLACRNRKQLMERRQTRPSWGEHALGLVASSASHGEWARDTAFLTPCLYWEGFSVMQGHLSVTCSWK